MKTKKVVNLLVISILILSCLILAEEQTTLDKASEWLISKENNGSYNNNPLDTAISAMALEQIKSIAKEKDYLLSSLSNENCLPRNSCKVKDTSLALNVLQNSEKEDEIESWLLNAQSAMPSSSGDWLIQIAGEGKGTCSISYDKKGKTLNKTIIFTDGKFEDCQNSTWLKISSCLDSSLSSIPNTELNFNCENIPGIVISLIFKSGNDFYVVDSVDSSSGTLHYENSCFGKSESSSCDYETTLYANWILNQKNDKTYSIVYLKKNYNEANALHNAFMYLITGEEIYLTALKENQKSDGSFNNDVITTALALNALWTASDFGEEYDETVSWLNQKQRSTGSFNSRVFDTAMVIYALSPSQSVSGSCTDLIKNQDERGIDCGGVCEALDDCCTNNVQDDGEDGIDCGGVCAECENLICNNDYTCDTERGEDYKNCPNDCSPSDSENEDKTNTCNYDNICDPLLESYLDCSDCYEGDGVCDYMEKEEGGNIDCQEEETTSEDYTPSEEESGGSGFFWFFIILLLIGGGVFYYFKYMKNKNKKPKKKEFPFGGDKYKSTSQSQKKPAPKTGLFSKPSQPIKKPLPHHKSLFGKSKTKSKIETDLDKSIKEARKVLGLKK